MPRFRSNSSQSIDTIDMTLEDLSDLQGKFTLKHKAWQVHGRALSYKDFTLPHPKRVKDVVAVIAAGGLDKYQFTPQGYGCRYWQLTLLQQLAERGFFYPNATDRALKFLLERFSRFDAPSAIDVVAIGTFDDADQQTLYLNNWIAMQKETEKRLDNLLQHIEGLRDRHRQYEAQAVNFNRRQRTLLIGEIRRTDDEIATAEKDVRRLTDQVQAMTQSTAQGQSLQHERQRPSRRRSSLLSPISAITPGFLRRLSIGKQP
ncbi:hypothetical protein K461DRAFT_315565 [Myriangium duriaei CBS 260.36]|uniref:DUF7770 domain-containing protein n=1 Tax=Myriangium duriaei CBS 260.36 TaxID=1168546 RepID=A0A9P4IXK4_9PEZI|nr:hypothetical protein K461DRAFT_315565 [Myriangium duriaei CBS 260.36]